jgi:hypothetical protein
VGATASLDTSEKNKSLALDRTRTMVPRSFGLWSRHHTDDVSMASYLLTLNRLLTVNKTGSLNENEVMLIVYCIYFNSISDICFFVSGQYQGQDGDVKKLFDVDC